MATRAVTFRLPEDVIELLKRQADATGKSKTNLVIDAITQAYEPSALSKPMTAQSLQQQISDLKKQVLSFEFANIQPKIELYDHTSQLVAAIQQAIHSSQGMGVSVSYIVVEGESQSPQNAASDARRLGENSASFLSDRSSNQDILDQILSPVSDPVFVCDRIGRLTYLNPASARMWQVDRSAMLGKTYQEFGFVPFMADFYIQQFQTVMTTGQSVTAEVSVPLSSGLRYYSYSFHPIQGPAESIDGVIGIARDLTESKQIEHDLRESREKYRNLFEFANDLILIVDAASEILEVNQCAARRLGYIRKDLEQQSIDAISTPESTHVWQEFIVPELEKLGGALFSYRFRRKNGDDLQVEISARLVEYGDQLAFQLLARDASEPRRTESFS
ncbi:MAG: PAS domain S-box protein [Elainellaceae cyanobacterium]